MNRVTLCVIDMQPYFIGCDSDTTSRVVDLVQRAIQRQMGIVVLEYSGCGGTSERICNLLRHYRKAAFVTKAKNDGSTEFIETCDFYGFSTSKIFVCGVFTEYCVAQTVRGLRTKLPYSRIAVVLKATNGANPGAAVDWASRFREQQVKVVV